MFVFEDRKSSRLFVFEDRKSRTQLAVTNRYISEPNTPTSSIPGCKPGVKTARKSCPQIQMFRCSESLKVSICPSSRPLRFMPSPFCARTFLSFLPLLCSHSTPTDYPARRTLSDALSIVVFHLSLSSCRPEVLTLDSASVDRIEWAVFPISFWLTTAPLSLQLVSLSRTYQL